MTDLGPLLSFALQVYDYDVELGIRTEETQSDDSDDDDDSDEESEESADGGENQNQNQNKSEAAMKKKANKKRKKAVEEGEEGDIDPLFGKRGKCPLQLLSEFIDAVTLKVGHISGFSSSPLLLLLSM